MNLKLLKDRLAYPHKNSALKYLLRNPSLALSVLTDKPSKFCLSRTLERVLGCGTDSCLLDSLCQTALDWARQNGIKDSNGERMLLYLVVRQYKPDIVVETGVAHGASSAFMLFAMHENAKGHLYSIDLPPRQVPARIAVTEKGCIHTMEDGQKHLIGDDYHVGDRVPGNLRDRWSLVLGDAKHELPKLLEEMGKVSIFLHDSLHTYEHMMFEYETAWPYLDTGGLLLSHDVLWNEAFLKFSKKVAAKPLIYRNVGIIGKC